MGLFIMLIICCSAELFAQERATGYSAPGRIGKLTLERGGKRSANDLVCTVGFEDPSGDFILNRDETIRMVVTIRNYSESLQIRPKIELLKLPDRDARPELKVIWTHRIGPGEMVTYTELVRWYEGRIPCEMIYRFKAFDPLLNIESDETEWRFEIQNEVKTE